MRLRVKGMVRWDESDRDTGRAGVTGTAVEAAKQTHRDMRLLL